MDRAKRQTIAAIVAGLGGAALASCGIGSGGTSTANSESADVATEWLRVVESKVEQILQSSSVPPELAAGGSLLFHETPAKYSELINMMQKRHSRVTDLKWSVIAYDSQSIVPTGALGNLAKGALTPSIVRVFMVGSGLQSVESNDILVVWVVRGKETSEILALHPQVLGK